MAAKGKKNRNPLPSKNNVKKKPKNVVQSISNFLFGKLLKQYFFTPKDLNNENVID